mmetsp:Transcript_29967/g.86208  ORF Transcript_29967/g.86208 Transcript_29967/m.86208 type:complete len:252 (-) Transcript_29967:1499-2254(-)
MVHLDGKGSAQCGRVDGLAKDVASGIDDGETPAAPTNVVVDAPVVKVDPLVVGDEIRRGLRIGDEPPARAQRRDVTADLRAPGVRKELLRGLLEGDRGAQGREVQLVRRPRLLAEAPHARKARAPRIRGDCALRHALPPPTVAPAVELRRAEVPSTPEAVELQGLRVVVTGVRKDESVRVLVVAAHLLARVGRSPIVALDGDLLARRGVQDLRQVPLVSCAEAFAALAGAVQEVALLRDRHGIGVVGCPLL